MRVYFLGRFVESNRRKVVLQMAHVQANLVRIGDVELDAEIPAFQLIYVVSCRTVALVSVRRFER